ncbi:MAG: hypothetical protein AAFX01_04245 [Cyanobacteria bacterium J06638_28]
MVSLIKKNFLTALFIVPIVTSGMVERATAQTINLNDFCQQFPLNSQCEGHASESSNEVEASKDFFQIVNVYLNVNGSEDEIVVLELSEQTIGNVTLSAYHMERSENDSFFTLSSLLNGALGAVAPVPFDLFQSFISQANQTEYIVFTPDGCMKELPLMNAQGLQLADCSIVGTDTLSFSEDVDIRAGYFTLGYKEADLLRAIVFRISNHNAEIISDFDLEHLCQSFPLNTQCRYWPISQVEPSTNTMLN